ncbi:hypothetical protein V8C86DRAFT_890773 [Haematococcus lacustris]
MSGCAATCWVRVAQVWAVRLGDVGPACLEQQLGCGRMTATQLPRPASWSHSQLVSVHTPAASSVAAASQPSTSQADMPGLVCDQRESASSQPWARSGGLCKRAGFPLSLTAPQQTCWPCPTTQPLTSSAWAVSGTRGIHGWAAATRNTNAIIRQLPSMEAVQQFWLRNGGSDADAKLRGPPRPCRLSHVSLACLLTHIAALQHRATLTAPSSQLPSTTAAGSSQLTPGEGSGAQQPDAAAAQEAEGTQGQGQGGHGAGEGKGGGGKDDKAQAEQQQQLQRLLAQWCERMERRSQLCDPGSAAQAMIALGRLGYQPPGPLVLLLLDMSMRRMAEAKPRDITGIAHGLALLGQQGSAAWWLAAARELQDAQDHAALQR